MATIQHKKQVLLDSLDAFYANSHNRDVLSFVLGKQSTVSLRILDWLVTNYAKKHNVVYTLCRDDGNARSFNLFVDYKSQLKAYSKKYFDPFCRRDRIEYTNSDGEIFYTTVGQLNFFRWAITNMVIKYANDHMDEIEADMVAATQHRYATTSTKGKRKELSRAAIKGCTKSSIVVTVRFA